MHLPAYSILARLEASRGCAPVGSIGQYFGLNRIIGVVLSLTIRMAVELFTPTKSQRK
jgi:hypothetical protein